MDHGDIGSIEETPPDLHAAVAEVLADLEAAPEQPVRLVDLLRGVVLILLPVAVVLGIFWWALDSFAYSGRRHYRHQPAPAVFRKVLGYPPPAGITELRAAGGSGPFGLKHHVWMSFRARPDALRKLLDGAFPLDRAKAEPYPRPPSAGPRHAAQDRAHVGWDAVDRIAKPEFYQLSSGGAPGLIWMDTLILDRGTGRAYLYAAGD